jgi:hypothetical protein
VAQENEKNWNGRLDVRAKLVMTLLKNLSIFAVHGNAKTRVPSAVEHLFDMADGREYNAQNVA